MWFWLVLIGFHPIMVMFMMQLNLIYQYWPHTELIPKLGWFDTIFNSPSNHRVHHGSNLQYLDRNYGGILIIWDRIFGTWEPENEKVRYGITTNIHTYNPFKITAHEWISIKNDLKRAPNLKAKLNYLFNSPGWSHDGKDQRAKTLRAEMEKKG
jgi:sterol desaturase/sphingolipid hydroxylase (fatty acid hydroxylase superfamily)